MKFGTKIIQEESAEQAQETEVTGEAGTRAGASQDEEHDNTSNIVLECNKSTKKGPLKYHKSPRHQILFVFSLRDQIALLNKPTIIPLSLRLQKIQLSLKLHKVGQGHLGNLRS